MSSYNEDFHLNFVFFGRINLTLIWSKSGRIGESVALFCVKQKKCPLIIQLEI
jgi:hypothetical protein